MRNVLLLHKIETLRLRAETGDPRIMAGDSLSGKTMDAVHILLVRTQPLALYTF